MTTSNTSPAALDDEEPEFMTNNRCNGWKWAARQLAAHPGDWMEFGVYKTMKSAWEAASRIRHRAYQWQKLVPDTYKFECRYEKRDSGVTLMIRVVKP